MAENTATAYWEGKLKDGKGGMAVGSGAFEADFSFGTRFEGKRGTNPEELIGAALAGCFSMALSAELEKAGSPPRRIQTEARVKLEQEGAGFTITHIALTTTAQVPGIEGGEFERIAEATKSACPVGKALSAVKISLDATLEA